MGSTYRVFENTDQGTSCNIEVATLSRLLYNQRYQVIYSSPGINIMAIKCRRIIWVAHVARIGGT